ncbi:hypothetical protein BBJ28_00008635 [Nothophytophthora sp. Chile5]|nr:hypothetical protein BBJ28_00008635 [Nothophytophthora sp. Chile5]
MLDSQLHPLAGQITPLKSSDKQPKKRTGVSGRMRLLPLAESPAQAYDMGSGNNNNNSNGGKNTLVAQKLKKITHKRELVEAVRKANTPIMLPGRETAVSTSMRSLHDGGGSNAAPETDASQRDIECLEDGVHLNARKFNDHKLMVERRHRELNTLLDELRVLQLETQALDRMQNQNTPVSKTNLRIKEHIAQCTASMEEQMHLRRQLEHMIRRLQTTQLRVDAQIVAMSSAVESSEREADEVKLLCRQLEAGKSRAVQFLQEVQLQLQVERKARARELGDHEVRARNSQKMEVWRLQRVQERAEMAAEMRGDLSAEEEARLLRCIESRERANEELHAANLAKSQKNADFEEVLAQLKMAMGATNLHEVVEKIAAQAATSSSLDKEKAQTEARLMAVRQEKEQALQTLNELKASGIGGIELNRDVYNALENEIQQAKTALKMNKSAYERLDGVMAAVRQGSFGLSQRLQVFDDVLEIGQGDNATEMGSPVATAGAGTGTGAGDNSLGPTPSMLSLLSGGKYAGYLVTAELKLTKILEVVGQSNSSVNNFGGYDGAGAGADANGGIEESSPRVEDGSGDGSTHVELLDDGNAMWSPTANNDPLLHENNIRVRPASRGVPAAAAMAVRIGVGVVDDDETPDSARSEVSSAGAGLDEEQMSVLVPSRDILKMSSSRHFAEVMRKKELVEKQKVAAEKGISDEEMVAKLRKRNQLEADTRLATSPTRHGAELFFAKAAAAAKEAAGSESASATGGLGSSSSDSIAFVTQLHFNDL